MTARRDRNHWRSAVLVAAATWSCGQSQRDPGELPDDGGTTGGEGSACVEVADAGRFVSGPVEQREPWVATPECPALPEGPLVLELPRPVDVTGTLEVQGVPTNATVRFVSLDGLGEVNAAAEDGLFAAEILPGSYDVSAMLATTDPGQWVVLDANAELTEDTQMVLDMPPSLQVTGSFLMDGQPPPDEFGYVHIVSNSGAIRSIPMSALDYTAELSPGVYRFVYSWCNRSEVLPPGHSVWCAGFSGPPILEGAPRISPEQEWAPFLQFDLQESTQLDLDVPTANLSGHITLDSVGTSDQEVLLRADDETSARLQIQADGSFGGRVVRGDYEAFIYPHGGALPDANSITEDTQIEVHRTSATVRALPPDSEIVQFNGCGGSCLSNLNIRLERHDSGPTPSWTTTPFARLQWSIDDSGGLASRYVATATVWPGTWTASLSGRACTGQEQLDEVGLFEDLAQNVVLAPALDLQSGSDQWLDTSLDLFAVRIDLIEQSDLAVPQGSLDPNAQPGLRVELFPEGEVTVPIISRRELDFAIGPDQVLDRRGYVNSGRYDVVYGGSLLGTVEIQPWTTLVLRPHSRELQAEWSVGGTPMGAAADTHHLFLRNMDTSRLRLHKNPEGQASGLPPGRYELIYVGWDEYGDGFPDNTDPRVGCVTVEG